MSDGVPTGVCPKCGAAVKLTVLIPPLGSARGVQVFQCPRCGQNVWADLFPHQPPQVIPLPSASGQQQQQPQPDDDPGDKG